MRKTLETTALVLTIVASLVAIIVYFSGRSSFLDLFSSPLSTHASSSTHASLPPTVTSYVDPLTTIEHSPMQGVAIIFLIVIIAITFYVAVISGGVQTLGLADSLLLVFGGPYIVMGVPVMVTYLTYEFLGLAIMNPVSLVVFGNIIIYPICLLFASIFKRMGPLSLLACVRDQKPPSHLALQKDTLGVIMSMQSVIHLVGRYRMARPKSQEKRNALLAAAIELIAEQGLSVPTSKIAHVAGVAEGTLFTYFETKERLLNDLYVELKLEEREEMMRDYPVHASLQDRARHLWDKYVGLGITHPSHYKVVTQLGVSDHLNEQSRRLGMEGYEALPAMLQECFTCGVLKDQPSAFGIALLLALMNMTIAFILQHPKEADRFCDAGFTAFWNAVTKT